MEIDTIQENNLKKKVEIDTIQENNLKKKY